LRSKLGRLVAAAGLIGLPAAFADGSTAKEQQLPEVVVTAQKIQQTLEQVPASVTSVSGDYIRDTGARDFQELSNYTANTNLQVSPTSTQLLVRGFGTLNDVPGLDSSVGVVVDGVVYTYPEYLTAFFGDLDRYEVLRGPQGTLFGKNVTAGLLNITTNAPDPRERLLRWDLDARSNGSRAFRPVINLPLGPGTAIRFSGDFDHGNHGQLYNTDLGRPEQNPQQDSGRMRFRYDSGAGWTMDVGAFVAHYEQNFNEQQLFIVQPHMLALDRYYDPHFTGRIGSNVSEDVPATQNATSRGASLTFDGDLGHPLGMKSLKITSITGSAENVMGARDLDADFSPVPFIRDSLAGPEPERQFTQELRLAGVSPNAFGLGHDVSFVTGLYYDNYTLRTSDDFQVEDLGGAAGYYLAAGCDAGTLPGFIANIFCGTPAALSGTTKLVDALFPPTSRPAVVSGLDLRTRDYAAFGQGEWYFSPRWVLLAGLRYAKEDRNGAPYSQSNSALLSAVAGQQNFSYTGNAKLHRTEADFSPKAGLKWQASSHTEAYFTWAEGYKSGGFNGIPLSPQQIEYQPEKASSLEAGFKIKNYLWGGPIRGSISIYHTRFSNLQVSTFEGTKVVVVNAAAARSQGFESDVMWLLPVRGLSVYGSFGFADARYTRYPDGPAPGDGKCQTYSPGYVPQAGVMASTCDLTGKSLPFAPQWTAAMTPAYTFLHLPYAISVGAAVDILYQGNRYLNPEDDPRTQQEATLVLNPRLIFADEANATWGLNLGIINITRQIYSDQVIDQPLAPGNYAAVRGDVGRLYSGSFFVDFR
jgi:outer membrane receptor protein involved in Fe transport